MEWLGGYAHSILDVESDLFTRRLSAPKSSVILLTDDALQVNPSYRFGKIFRRDSTHYFSILCYSRFRVVGNVHSPGSGWAVNEC